MSDDDRQALVDRHNILVAENAKLLEEKIIADRVILDLRQKVSGYETMISRAQHAGCEE